MAKKKKNMENEIVNEVVETIEEVQPIMKIEVIESTLKVGSIAITHNEKGGRIVINENQYGSLYKEDSWTIIETYKKK